jgi:proline dehydrogenase
MTTTAAGSHSLVLADDRSPHPWQDTAAMALRSVARDEDIKAYISNHPALYSALYRGARRFVAGEELDSCIALARSLNANKISATIDFMGESTRSLEQATAATEEFCSIARRIASEGLDCSISLDLSHIGLALDRGLACENLIAIAGAADSNIEVMISMEGSERTDAVLETYYRVSADCPNVGITLQANMLRTESDLKQTLSRPGKIRLVKGAFAESPDTAQLRGINLDQTYLALLDRIVSSGHSCSVGTHDQTLLDAAHEMLVSKGQVHSNVEFEMLHGATPDRLDQMKQRGYRVREYLAYGTEWYLYVCHRLAEYPPNIFKFLGDMSLPEQCR